MALQYANSTSLFHTHWFRRHDKNETKVTSRHLAQICGILKYCVLCLPNGITSDWESKVTSELFWDVSSTYWIYLQLSTVKVRRSIEIGERYHMHMRKIYKVLQEAHSALDKQIFLQSVIKRIIVRTTAKGLVRSSVCSCASVTCG